MQINLKREKRVKYIISFLTLVLLLPSIFFAYQLFEEKKYKQKVELFLNSEFIEKGYTIMYKKTKFISNPKKIELAFLSKKFTNNEIKVLKEKLKTYELGNTVLTIVQDTTDLKRDILNEISFNNKTMSEKDLIINQLKNKITASKFDNKALLVETKILFPGIENIAVANPVFNENIPTKKAATVILYQSKKDFNSSEKEKFSLWLKNKFKTENLEIYKRE